MSHLKKDVHIIDQCEMPAGYPVHADMHTASATGKYYADLIKEWANGKPVRLVFSGTSGSILATCIYVNLGQQDCMLYQVRKEHEKHHDSSAFSPADFGFEVDFFSSFNVVIDDIVVTGATLTRIFNTLSIYDIARDIDAVLCDYAYRKLDRWGDVIPENNRIKFMT